MKKLEFIYALRDKLRGLPLEDIERSVEYYGEMIDDRIEDGMDEESAVRDVGELDGIVSDILRDTPIPRLVKEKLKTQKKRKMRAWEIVLIILGSPIWLSLAIAAFAVILSLYIVLWSVIIAVFAVFASLGASALGVYFASVVFIISGNTLSGLAAIGAGSVCAGLAIFAFFGCRAATYEILRLTKAIALSIKKLFIKKEESHE